MTKAGWVDYLTQLSERGELAIDDWGHAGCYCAVGHIALEYGIDVEDVWGDDVLYQLSACDTAFSLHELKAIVRLNDAYGNTPQFGPKLAELVWGGER